MTVNLGCGARRTAPPSASRRSLMERSPRPAGAPFGKMLLGAPPPGHWPRSGTAPSLSTATRQNAG